MCEASKKSLLDERTEKMISQKKFIRDLEDENKKLKLQDEPTKKNLGISLVGRSRKMLTDIIVQKMDQWKNSQRLCWQADH